MNRTEVIKHSSAIQIANRITLLQRRAWNVMLAHAYDELPTAATHSMKVTDLIERLNISSNNTEHLREVLLGLRRTEVEWNVLGKDGGQVWGNAALLADVEIRNGVIEYSFSGILRKRLHNPAIYTRIKLAIQNQFGSKHALALYELLVDHLGVGQTKWIGIEDFRRLMGLEDEDYPEFKVLNRNVIKGGLDEINAVSDVTGSVEYRKEGRRVVSLKFHVKAKPQLKDKLPGVAPPAARSAGDGMASPAPIIIQMEVDAFDAYFEGLTPLEQAALRAQAEKVVDQQGELPPRTREGMVQAEMRRLWNECAPS